MDGARSIASVLHGRLQRLALPQPGGHEVTWAQRTPASAPAAARELAAALDDRARALGEQMAVSPEPWLARQLGVVAPAASPALREEYARRAGLAAATAKPPESPTPDKRSPYSCTAATPSSRPCVRQYLLRWRSATKQLLSAACAAASWKRGSSPVNAPRPPPRRT